MVAVEERLTATRNGPSVVLADPSLLPEKVRRALPGKATHPETVNCDEPPSKLLIRLSREKSGKSYIKTTYGPDLFSRLDPDRVYQTCPSFRAMMDELLALAKARQAR